MKTLHSLTALCAAAALLAGCVETGDMDAGLSGTADQFDAMRAPCKAQAARMTGTSVHSVSILDSIQTGGGPILKYTCRLEPDGRVTVFSEYAN